MKESKNLKQKENIKRVASYIPINKKDSELYSVHVAMYITTTSRIVILSHS